MPPPIARAARLRADLDRLGDDVGAAGFALPSVDQAHRRVRRDRVMRTIASYLGPRLGALDAPLLVVVAGPTGSGKSTLVNSLAGSAVSRPGALRPTTRAPVVWCHRDHRDRFATVGGVECEVVADDHPLLADVAVVDTPDIDSYVGAHRAMTVQILLHADVVVFVTSAQRYADAVPWEILTEIDRRGSVIVTVLNRLGRRSAGAVSDYAALLRERGLAPEPIHTIQEQRVRGDAGTLPSRAVRHVETRLAELAAGRQEVVATVTEMCVAHVVAEAGAVAADLDAQAIEADRLHAVVDEVYDGGFSEVTAELERGALIRSEIVERWNERVGAGAVARWVKGSASAVRGTIDRVSGRPAAIIEDVEREARRELIDAVGSRLDRAARSVVTAWAVDEAGRELSTEDLAITATEAKEEIAAEVDAWLAGLTELVSEEAPGRFRAARVASTGVNAATVATIVAVFASTGGLTGAEAGVAAGAAAAQQGMLEHVLGRAAAGSLTGTARTRLVASIRELFDAEADRFHRVVEAASDPGERAASILDSAERVALESEAFHGR